MVRDGAAVLIASPGGLPTGIGQRHLPAGDFQLSVAFESLNATLGSVVFGFSDLAATSLMGVNLTSSKMEIDGSESGVQTVLKEMTTSVCNGRIDFSRTGSEMTVTVTAGGETISTSAEGFAAADWLMMIATDDASVKLTDISGSGDTAATLIDSFDCDSVARN